MRTKQQIQDAVEESRSTVYTNDCLLEVLLDIRDLLAKRDTYNPLQVNPPQPSNLGGEWCVCGEWKQYGVKDTHHCTGYKVTC